ncbi:XRE family transcriptional regulator [Listeria monocytogenes]|uniref:XRE family transcriptional regulator n=1 Tax=Listeria monocytogenes TaxID=1639 RepID=UPI0021CDC705|nr:XRE family transcriptional regulator [Listeria monocytogenes]
MYVDINGLKKKISEKNKSINNVADYLGIDRSTFYRKLQNGGLTFTIREVHKIVDGIPLSKKEATEIFLCKKSLKCDKQKLVKN